MIKYLICSIIGNGTKVNPRRPKIADYDCSWSAIYEAFSGNETYSLVCSDVLEDVFSQIVLDSDIYYLTEDLDQIMTSAEYDSLNLTGKINLDFIENETWNDFLLRLAENYSGVVSELPEVVSEIPGTY